MSQVSRQGTQGIEFITLVISPPTKHANSVVAPSGANASGANSGDKILNYNDGLSSSSVASQKGDNLN